MTDSKTLPRIINVIGPIAIFAFNGYLWSLMFPSMQANPYLTTGIGTLLGIFAAYLEIRASFALITGRLGFAAGLACSTAVTWKCYQP